MASPAPMAQRQHQPQGLPSIANLTNGLPRSAPISPDQASLTDSTRDSGTWPQPQSKHNSATSQGLQVRTLLNPDDSPSRQSIPSTPLSARQPISATSAGGSTLPSINQGFHDPNHRESYTSSYRESYGSYNRDSLGRDLTRDSREVAPSLDSRRSSVDSRMHQNFNSLYINNNNTNNNSNNNNNNGPASPYESANTSQVSLAASLRRPNGQNPVSPLSGRSHPRAAPPRQAPVITTVGRGPGVPDPTASKPTVGYAWAFPDGPIPEEESRRDSDSAESGLGPAISRQNSFAASSIRSSIFSTDSGFPPGQRPFPDDPATTHHHSMQHRAVSNAQNDALVAQGMGNYSRTPELRISHKLAERKRRSEMKDLFEELNKAVPSNGGTKASKWEILTKAIDYIRSTQAHEINLHQEVQRLQAYQDTSREVYKENESLKTELQVMHSHLRRLEPTHAHVYGSYTSRLVQPQAPSQAAGPGPMSLPPMNTGPPGVQNAPPPAFGNPPPPPAPMQGVEYGYSR